MRALAPGQAARAPPRALLWRLLCGWARAVAVAAAEAREGRQHRADGLRSRQGQLDGDAAPAGPAAEEPAPLSSEKPCILGSGLGIQAASNPRPPARQVGRLAPQRRRAGQLRPAWRLDLEELGGVAGLGRLGASSPAGQRLSRGQARRGRPRALRRGQSPWQPSLLERAIPASLHED